MDTDAVLPESVADRALRTRLLQALAVIVVPLVLLIGLETYQIVNRGPAVQHNRDLVIGTFRVISVVQSLDRALQDAERGQRGFLLTGSKAYLAPYNSGARDAPSLLARLKALTEDSAEQQRRLAELEPQVKIKLDELAASVALREKQGFTAALALVQTDTGLNSMRAITGLLDALIAHENALLKDRLSRTGEDEQASANVALLGGLVAFASMFIGVLLALMAFRSARATELARRDSEQRFRLLVDGVTDHAIYLLDATGHVNNWNAGAQRLKGYAAEEIIGQHFSRFYTEEDRANGVPVRALATALNSSI